MNSRQIALGLGAIGGAFAVAAVVLLMSSWDAPVPDAWGFRGYAILEAVGFTSVGTFVAVRRGRNPIGWLLLAAGVLTAVAAFALQYAEYTIVGGHPEWPGGVFTAWLASWLWAPVVNFIIPVVLLRFPDGRLITPWLRPVEWFAAITTASLSAYFAIKPGLLQLAAFGENPFPVDVPELLGVLIALGTIGFVTDGVAALSVVARFRRSRGIERLQVKWLAFSVLPLVVAGVASAVLPDKAGQVLYVFLQLLLPITIGIAVLRYRLYDIDLLIRRTLIYTSLSAVLLVAYVAAVAVLQTALAPFTSGNGVAVAVSTLAVVTLFQPVRRRIQALVDRRFYRARYDASRVLDAFGTRLRDEVDLDAVRQGLVDAVEHTVQPIHASVWLRGSTR